MNQLNLTSSHSNGPQEYGSGAFSMMHLNRMEKWADRNFMKLSKERWKVLHLERNKKMEPGAFQCQVQGQWTQTEMQNVPFEHQETIFLSALAQIGQGGCGMPTFGGTKNV